MPLTLEQIKPDAVAYFDADALNSSENVSITGSPVKRIGTTGARNQFVCYKVVDGRRHWAPLTGTFRKERLPIDPDWVSFGYGALKAGGVYLQDGGCTYVNSNEAFITAAAEEEEFKQGSRPFISEVGSSKLSRQSRNARGNFELMAAQPNWSFNADATAGHAFDILMAFRGALRTTCSGAG